MHARLSAAGFVYAFAATVQQSFLSETSAAKAQQVE